MRASRSATRTLSESGSKVITDPGELGPDLLQALVERLAVYVGHGESVSMADVGAWYEFARLGYCAV
jgi:hypothetical protein